jgi:Trypsin
VEITKHPNFTLSTFNFDFALLKMDLPLLFNDNIKPVMLPASGEVVKDGAVCLVSGFGLNENYEYPTELLATKVMKFYASTNPT